MYCVFVGLLLLQVYLGTCGPHYFLMISVAFNFVEGPFCKAKSPRTHTQLQILAVYG